MSNERIIYTADLSHIERNLGRLSENIGYVSQQINSVQSDVESAQSRIEQLAQEFFEFVQQDLMAKELQLAETRLVKVRQELENTYGYYDEVRRRTTGILQAVDINVVKKETINNCTEELMLAAPRYWLAPALVAISAWISDDRKLAEKAVKEALRRDDEKASLLFTLISRRAEKYDASEVWLERYFGMQDSTSLEREMVIVIDAFANGLFGADSHGLCSKQMQLWITELSERDGFVEEQQQQWSKAILSKIKKQDGNKYPYLRKQSPTWDLLEKAMEGVMLNQIIKDHFESIFDGPIIASSIKAEIDDLLTKLVANFDNEELPLRRDERHLTLIVEADGDRRSADDKFKLEQKALDERFSFTQLLTNSAMHPETSHASKATQRLAVALSRDWIVKAYSDLTAANRSNVPVDIEIKVGDWVGTTIDGSNEENLVSLLDTHINAKLNKALEKLKVGGLSWAAAVCGGIMTLAGIANNLEPTMTLIGLGGVGWIFYAKSKVEKDRNKVRRNFEEQKAAARQILQAALAEVVDWKREYETEDAKYDKVVEFLESITPEQFIASTFNNVRIMIK